jgi:RNA polymerase sigma-70 factor (ECF subfamily)
LNLKASLLDYSIEGGRSHRPVLATSASTKARDDSDEALLCRVAEGDEASFSRLYERYGHSVYNYILRLLHDEAAAENLVQDSFVAVWEGAARFSGQSKARTWLFQIAHHRAVDWLRREARRDAVEDAGSATLGSDGLAHGDDPETLAFRATDALGVKRALDTLSPAHRAVVELTFFMGFSYQEIALILDCPVGTVKSRMSWARTYLAEALGPSSTHPGGGS